jgi:hypothetical protein
MIFSSTMFATRGRTLAALLACLAAACSGTEGPRPSPFPPSGGTAVLVGAGDIGVCGSAGTAATAALLDGIDGTVFTAGDNAYFQGTEENFRRCYDPTWGRHKERTRPAPGNHDYESPGAAPYFEYFGANAGPPGLGYYEFQAGAWQIVSLNSNVPAGEGSPQYEWLRGTLTGTRTACVAAIWHHPLVASGPNGSNPHMRDIWRLLQQTAAELVIVGHEHQYERFAPLDFTGRPASDGLRQFVVGTGGAPLSSFDRSLPGSEARAATFGVLKLTLQPGSYSWEFISTTSGISDTGTGTCR